MTRTFTLLLALLLVAIAVPVLVVAQRVGGAQATDNGPFGALRWRSVGPARRSLPRRDR